MPQFKPSDLLIALPLVAVVVTFFVIRWTGHESHAIDLGLFLSLFPLYLLVYWPFGKKSLNDKADEANK